MHSHYGGGEPAAGVFFGFLCLAVVALAFAAFAALCWCLIFRKAGWHWAMGLLVLIPGLGGLIVLLMLAFAEWPVQREFRALRAGAGGLPKA